MKQIIEKKDIKFYLCIFIVLTVFCLILGNNAVLDDQKSIIIYSTALIITIIRIAEITTAIQKYLIMSLKSRHLLLLLAVHPSARLKTKQTTRSANA